MKAATERLRVGIVGLGRLGKRHAENLAWRVPGADARRRVQSAAKTSARGRATRCPSRVSTTTTRTLLADPDVDAVWLVTPTSLHAQQIIEALRAGKHVFCEKPLSLELAECERVLAEAARIRI